MKEASGKSLPLGKSQKSVGVGRRIRVFFYVCAVFVSTAPVEASSYDRSVSGSFSSSESDDVDQGERRASFPYGASVRIQSFKEEDMDQDEECRSFFSGSGVLVGPCLVLTAAHNIVDREKEEKGEKGQVFATRQGSFLIECFMAYQREAPKKEGEGGSKTEEEKMRCRRNVVEQDLFMKEYLTSPTEASDARCDFALLEVNRPFKGFRYTCLRNLSLEGASAFVGSFLKIILFADGGGKSSYICGLQCDAYSRQEETQKTFFIDMSKRLLFERWYAFFRKGRELSKMDCLRDLRPRGDVSSIDVLSSRLGNISLTDSSQKGGDHDVMGPLLMESFKACLLLAG